MAPAADPGEQAWYRLLNPGLPQRLGRLRRVLFDFDGTLSLLRAGWESVMIPLMLRSICGERLAPPAIEQEVRAYVDRSTGLLTIRQMQWLAEAVARHGLVGEAKTAAAYKAEYVVELLEHIADRKQGLLAGALAPDDLLLRGARAFVSGLAQRGLELCLASGTDHVYVVEEARLLALEAFFAGHIYGALDDSEANDKEQVIRRLLDRQPEQLGAGLLVVGDGPVEMRLGRACGALTLGVASDEAAGAGWNEHKAARLAAAGAELLVADYAHSHELVQMLCDHKIS
jgi:phosphoglycolate phosphatase-like HAD superfamily hydrolase